MAQTGLVTYTADFVYGFMLRVLGTIMGGDIGMVCCPPIQRRDLTAEKSTIEIAEALSSLAGPFGLLRFEFSSSNFYSKTLGQVMSLCMAINQNISQLFNCAISPPEDLKARFARFTGALDERFVGDTMAVLSLVEQALKTGDPLLAVLPTPLVSHCLGVHEKPMGDDQDILSVDVIRRRDFRKYCVVLSAFVGLLSGSMSSSLRSKGR
ncbi:hypothetical protein BJ546DRAFT_1097592 [Cryomyces antarcticus]